MQSVVTPVNVEEYEKLLHETEYDPEESQFLISGFKEGFSIGYKGDVNVQQTAPNLKLECGTKFDIWQKVMKEVKLGRYAGPFDEIPFDNFIQSPIGLVPKGENGHDTRLIFHLSYPRSGNSVNSQMPKEWCTVHYNELDQAIAMCVEAGKGCYITKSDMKSTFCNLPIKPGDWKCLHIILQLTKNCFL